MSMRSSSLLTRRILARPAPSPLVLASTAELHTERKAAKHVNGSSSNISNSNAQHDGSAPTRAKSAGAAAHDRRKRQFRSPAPPKSDFFSETSDSDEKKRLVSAYKDGKPLITVMGLGGAGNNAVNNMIASQLEGVEFIVANTDCQALGRSLAPHKITLGKEVTKGLGAGSKPQLGKLSAEMQRDEIELALQDSNMLFITGGMGGGTCTGAAPVVASIARELGILTVGVVSTPFRSEGPNRTRLAHAGVKELAKYVDTLIVVPNQNLLALSTKSTTMLEAFRYADDVLLEGVKGVTDLIVRPGLINLDFADIKTILSNAGRAIMGSGTSSDVDRAEKAAEQALVNPLLGDLPTESALGLLVTIRGGDDMTLFEVDRIMEIIRTRVSEDANIIFGTCYDSSLQGSVHVSIIVSGIQTDLISPPVPTQPFVPFSELQRDAQHAAGTAAAGGGSDAAASRTSASAEDATDAATTSPKPKRGGLFSRFFS